MWWRSLYASLVVLGGCAFGEPVDPFSSAGVGASGSGGEGGAAPSSSSSSVGGSASDGAGAGASGGAGLGGGGAGSSCGDGTVDPGEECDDGNAVASDGCTNCQIDCAATDHKRPGTGHCYRVFVAASTQPVAEANCRAWGGAPGLAHLASIEDAAENDFVAPLVSSNTWIGADDFGGDWAWIDGTPYAFENWQAGEPNHPGIEHCMFMNSNGRWHDHNCGDTRSAYLCERRGAGTF